MLRATLMPLGEFDLPQVSCTMSIVPIVVFPVLLAIVNTQIVSRLIQSQSDNGSVQASPNVDTEPTTNATNSDPLLDGIDKPPASVANTSSNHHSALSETEDKLAEIFDVIASVEQILDNLDKHGDSENYDSNVVAAQLGVAEPAHLRNSLNALVH
jgi:hypothetical protein